MIKDYLAVPVYHAATKDFSKLLDPSKPTIQLIFHDFWKDFLLDPQVIKNGVRPVVIKEVNKMISCGTLDAGFEVFECPNCHQSSIICYTCKSRFCNSCGVRYAQARAASISKSALDVPHRHVVFTIDSRLRSFFQKDRILLNALFDAAQDTLMYTFAKMVSKKKKLVPGFILTLHTFGRDLKWNPHIHCLLTEGGIDVDDNYIPISYINYEVLRKSFMKQLLDKMKEFYSNDPVNLRIIKSLIDQLYTEDSNGFYIHAPKMKTKNGKDATINYIIRYTGRPAMAQSRIISYDYSKKMVHYYYEDHKTNERIDVEENVIDFMKKLVIHIPEKQFKMIRYYGIYATCDHKRKPKVKQMLSKAIKRCREFLNYRRSLIDTFNTDPLLCSCGHIMEFVDYWVPPSIRDEEKYYVPTQ